MSYNIKILRDLLSVAQGVSQELMHDSRAALAELERAAAEPVAWRYDLLSGLRWYAGCFSGVPLPDSFYVRNIVPLYAAPPTPVSEIREVRTFTAEEMEDAYKEGAYDVRYGSGIQNREWQNSVTRSLIQERAELGLVKLKEPTPEECERISMAYYDDEALVDRDHRHLGKDMFDACRAVLWPKEGE